MIATTPARVILLAALLGGGTAAVAAQVGPPMLDIAGQCGTASRRNATAMSECVVAESEARADILQNWSKYSDDDAERCIKLGRKAKRLPYSAIARCLSAVQPANAPAAASVR